MTSPHGLLSCWISSKATSSSTMRRPHRATRPPSTAATKTNQRGASSCRHGTSARTCRPNSVSRRKSVCAIWIAGSLLWRHTPRSGCFMLCESTSKTAGVCGCAAMTASSASGRWTQPRLTSPTARPRSNSTPTATTSTNWSHTPSACANGSRSMPTARTTCRGSGRRLSSKSTASCRTSSTARAATESRCSSVNSSSVCLKRWQRTSPH